jgi:sugar phosphate isomerase/epimerase
MIYVSSAASAKKRIGEAVRELAELGLTNIELTGGTKYYDGYQEELRKLKEEFNLNYLVHNYFPPPEQPFVLNLASLNDDIYKKSIEHGCRAIALSKKLEARQLGFHGGFFIDIRVKEIGQKLTKDRLFNQEQAIERFCQAFSLLKDEAGEAVKLYVENNVFSQTNARTYEGENPFMITHYEGYLELKKLMDFNLLLDVAHLKVSATSLGLDFEKELEKMIAISDYIHLSENDGLHDLNQGFLENSETLQKLKRYNFQTKTLTLEIYNQTAKLWNDYEIVKETLKLDL